jgi:virginiamycin B lyase
VGPDGALWFTNYGNNSIGRITTAGVVTTYTSATIDGPKGITAGPDGALWFTTVGPDKALWVIDSGVDTGVGWIDRVGTAGMVTIYNSTVITYGIGDITAGPDGALWFSMYSAIGKITTAGVVTSYTGSSVSAAQGITVRPDNALWFTNDGNNSIGRITTAGVISSHGGDVSPGPSITAGPDGALWFPNRGTDSIGRITTAGVITNYIDPRIVDPEGITVGPDDALWFTNDNFNDYADNSIGRITTSGVITTYTSNTITSPGGITAGPDGALWFTNGTDLIGRITTSGAITNYTASTIYEPTDITAGPDGALWFINSYNNSIGRITPAGVVTNYVVNGVNLLNGIAAGPDKALWFTLSGSIGRLKVTPPPKPTFTSGPRLSGPAKVGKADTCSFTNSGATSAAIRWLVSGAAQKGATARTFTPTAADVGRLLSCSVTLTNSSGSVTGTSASVKVALGAALAVVRNPVLSGPHKAGKAEAVSTGAWSPAATSYTYQWYLGTARIAHATSSRYTPPTTDKGKKLHCAVTAHRAGYASGTHATPAVTLG